MPAKALNCYGSVSSMLKRKTYIDIGKDKKSSPCVFHEYLVASKNYFARFFHGFRFAEINLVILKIVSY